MIVMRGTVPTILLCNGVDPSHIWPFQQNTVVIVIGQTDEIPSPQFGPYVEWLFGQFPIVNNDYFVTCIVVILQA
jgi:hypothetical protein